MIYPEFDNLLPFLVSLSILNNKLFISFCLPLINNLLPIYGVTYNK